MKSNKILITIFITLSLTGSSGYFLYRKNKNKTTPLPTAPTKDKEKKEPAKNSNNQETKKNNDNTKPKEKEEEWFLTSWKFIILLSLIILFISIVLLWFTFYCLLDGKGWEIFKLLIKINKEQKKFINSKANKEECAKNIGEWENKITKLRGFGGVPYKGENIVIVTQAAGFFNVYSFIFHLIAMVILPFFLAISGKKNKGNYSWRLKRIFVNNLKLLLSFVLIFTLSFVCGCVLTCSYNNTAELFNTEILK